MKRISIDPMIALRAKAKERVNSKYAMISIANAHRDQAHLRKKDVARQVLGGEAVPAWFTEEAELRGITITELASMIRSFNPEIDAREIARQRELAAIDQALTVQDIEAISPAPPEQIAMLL